MPYVKPASEVLRASGVYHVPQEPGVEGDALILDSRYDAVKVFAHYS